MSGGRRDRTFIVTSTVVLLVALVAGIWMLLRARTIWQDEERAAVRVGLMERRDELRGAVAELTSLRALTALPREHALAADLRGVLRDTARRFQERPLEDNDDPGVFACVALEVGSGPDGLAVWSSGAIDPDDRSWCLSAISAGGSDEGAQRITGDSRVLGVAWAAFRVDGAPRIGALAWITPRSR